MKKIIIATLLTLTAANAIAADLKIGFVSVEKLLTEAPQVEAVNTAMLDRFGGKKKELEDMQKELQAMQEDYKRNELVMTEDKLKELQGQLIGKMQLFKQKEATLAQEVNTMRSQELAVLQKSVRDIINDIAKREHYDLVLSEGVVFASESLDITSTVLDQMKKDFNKKK
ncbi:MAG: OmpH family outer membrane protein [Gammaproteobacteria bacterium]|nr:OmpH family outer membrane protein [Gammaproteobacteria bacterium]